MSAMNVSDYANTSDQAGVSSELQYYMKGVLLPILGLCGVVGNTLNLLVLSWRYKCRGVDVLEKGALLGLIALAVSDLFFCLGLLPYLSFYASKTMFRAPSLQMYHQIYNSYYQNVFQRISSWLTTLVALARYIVICHPFQARIFIGLSRIRFAIVCTYIFWIVFQLPMAWTYRIHEWPQENGTTVYLVDTGYFNEIPQVHMILIYLWSILGSFLPIVIVTFCNIRFIFALRESMKLHATSVWSHKSTDWDYTVRITVTLIALIVAFLLLVTPAEITHFYTYMVSSEKYFVYEMATLVTNNLQAVNFAFHFLLYFAVNVTFRRSLVALLRKCSMFKPKHPVDQAYSDNLLHDYNGKRYSKSRNDTVQESFV